METNMLDYIKETPATALSDPVIRDGVQVSVQHKV